MTVSARGTRTPECAQLLSSITLVYHPPPTRTIHPPSLSSLPCRATAVFTERVQHINHHIRGPLNGAHTVRSENSTEAYTKTHRKIPRNRYTYKCSGTWNRAPSTRSCVKASQSVLNSPRLFHDRIAGDGRAPDLDALFIHHMSVSMTTVIDSQHRRYSPCRNARPSVDRRARVEADVVHDGFRALTHTRRRLVESHRVHGSLEG